MGATTFKYDVQSVVTLQNLEYLDWDLNSLITKNFDYLIAYSKKKHSPNQQTRQLISELNYVI